MLTRRKLLTRRAIIAAPAIIGLAGFHPLGGASGSNAFTTLLAGITPGNWLQASLNNFSDVATPQADWPNPGSGDGPATIPRMWCCEAWDPNRDRLDLWGGGHATYNGNEVYSWNSGTFKWERCAVPTQWNGSNTLPLTSDGYLNSPVAAHPYNATVYLPVLDRLAVFGGAASGSGGPFVRSTGVVTGPYFFNPALADIRTTATISGQKVGGLVNSDALGTAPAGNMWQNRDNIVGNTNTVVAALAACAYALESGADVVYLVTPNGGNLIRYVPSASGPGSDTYATAGASFHNTKNGPIAYAPDRKCMVKMTCDSGGANPQWSYWDLTSQGGGNNDVIFIPTDNSGSFPATNINVFGIDYDEQFSRFAIVDTSGTGKVWTLTPPSPLSATGWVINLAPAPVGPVPGFDALSNGVYGLWRRVKNHQVFVYAADVATSPTVWFYKSHA